MILLKEIEIKNFRSIKKCNIKNIKDFNSFFGLNNSGKSNILRALNLFFNNETDNQRDLDFESDFHQSKSKKKQEISISVQFELPENFKFKKTLEKVESFILTPKNDRKVKIRKIFGREYWFPEKIYLNDTEVKEKNLRNIERFLKLINFRYIPNRVLPVEILKEEGNSIKKALAKKLNQRRLDKQKINDAIENLSKAILDTSRKLILPISEELKKISPKTTVELITPESIEDLISTSGYFLNTEHIKIKDIYQGSGIQSFLMFHTLHLIDKDYAQQFGWKQATIWAVEEPESSLHFDLEAQLAYFLFKTVIAKNSRLQFFCTTHSTLFAEHSQQSIIVEKQETETKCREISSNEIYNETTKSGISKYTHPVLFYPKQDILLCEGKQDVDFVNKIFNIFELDAQSKLYITCLSDLTNTDSKGGAETIQKYIKEHKEMIKIRNNVHRTNIIVLLDWDIDLNKKVWNKIELFEGVFVNQWPKDKVNEKTKKLRGIESLYPERFFDEAIKIDKFKDILSKDGHGNYAYAIQSSPNKSLLNSLKDHLNKKIKSELIKKDITNIESFVRKLVKNNLNRS